MAMTASPAIRALAGTPANLEATERQAPGRIVTRPAPAAAPSAIPRKAPRDPASSTAVNAMTASAIAIDRRRVVAAIATASGPRTMRNVATRFGELKYSPTNDGRSGGIANRPTRPHQTIHSRITSMM